MTFILLRGEKLSMHNFRPAMICRGYRVPGAWIAHGGYLGITCVLSSLFVGYQCGYLLLGLWKPLILLLFCNVELHYSTLGGIQYFQFS